MMADTQASTAAKRGFRRKLVGVITSDRMDKTVVVEVARRTVAPKYKKYMRSRERYAAHDEANEYRVGDRVEISESHPLSRSKRWVVSRMIRAAADREAAPAGGAG